MRTPIHPIDRIHWCNCVNGGGETIPAFGAVRVASVADDGTLSVEKPDTDGQDVFFNGESDIPAGGYGVCTRDWPAYALYESGDGSPGSGDKWGAGAGSWKLRKGKAGFRVLGGATGSRVQVRGAASSADTVNYVAQTPGGGIPALSGTTPGSASCGIYHLVSGSLSVLNDANNNPITETVYSLLPIAIPGGTWITIHQDADGDWWIPSQGLNFGACP
jgi:hypothetical protein